MNFFSHHLPDSYASSVACATYNSVLSARVEQRDLHKNIDLVHAKISEQQAKQEVYNQTTEHSILNGRPEIANVEHNQDTTNLARNISSLHLSGSNSSILNASPEMAHAKQIQGTDNIERNICSHHLLDSNASILDGSPKMVNAEQNLDSSDLERNIGSHHLLDSNASILDGSPEMKDAEQNQDTANLGRNISLHHLPESNGSSAEHAPYNNVLNERAEDKCLAGTKRPLNRPDINGLGIPGRGCRSAKEDQEDRKASDTPSMTSQSTDGLITEGSIVLMDD
jgi:hypothetical protein